MLVGQLTELLFQIHTTLTAQVKASPFLESGEESVTSYLNLMSRSKEVKTTHLRKW